MHTFFNILYSDDFLYKNSHNPYTHGQTIYILNGKTKDVLEGIYQERKNENRRNGKDCFYLYVKNIIGDVPKQFVMNDDISGDIYVNWNANSWGSFQRVYHTANLEDLCRFIVHNCESEISSNKREIERLESNIKYFKEKLKPQEA